MIKVINPDVLYKSMINSPNPPYDKIIEFIKKEAESYISLKGVIDGCDSEKEFTKQFDYMIKLTNDIRSDTLDLLIDNYHIYQLKKRRFCNRIRTYIKR